MGLCYKICQVLRAMLHSLALRRAPISRQNILLIPGLDVRIKAWVPHVLHTDSITEENKSCNSHRRVRCHSVRWQHQLGPPPPPCRNQHWPSAAPATYHLPPKISTKIRLKIIYKAELAGSFVLNLSKHYLNASFYLNRWLFNLCVCPCCVHGGAFSHHHRSICHTPHDSRSWTVLKQLLLSYKENEGKVCKR